MDLFGNETTMIHFDETENMFKFEFDNVTCRHERRYKCLLLVTSSSISVLPRLFESDAIWISVTVPPSKPEMNLPTKVNDLSDGKRNKRAVTIMPKNDTLEQDFIEGDNITFICEGDVGRPEGKFEWQKMYANNEELTYSNTLTETIPESCSFDGNSTLTLQVTGDDNQAIIRCIVKSEVSQVFLYEDSEPLRIQFQVRIPVIELQPDKTVFLEGDSVLLKCQSKGNPGPSYSWLKGNGSNETIIAYTDSFVIENANITDSGLYTCYTNNSIDGNVYKEINSTFISIAEKSTSHITSTFSPIETDNTKDLLIAVFGSVAFFTMILCVIVVRVCISKKRQTSSLKLSGYGLKMMTNTKKPNDENKETNNVAEHQQKDTYLNPRMSGERSLTYKYIPCCPHSLCYNVKDLNSSGQKLE
ncbi:Hypothetical predicted protein [Mytilus galloprovincialis]|nr:Hypothetical predicted protein [Mytilus galloprovincialis]